MAISSINLKLAIIFAFFHNTREAIVSYLIADSSRNSYDKNGKEAYSYYIKLLKEATSNYTKRTKQRIQTDKKRFLWEAVLNLDHHHELKDVENLAKVLESVYGWRPIQTSVHHDEGHRDKKSGKIIYNYHAHVVFFMLNKEGIYCFKKRDFGIKKMVELQTIVAMILKMERGVSKKKTGNIRLEHGQYKQVSQEKEKMQLEIDELKLEVSEQNAVIFNLLADMPDQDHKDQLAAKDKKIKALLESNKKLIDENDSLVTEAEDDKFFMSNQAKEIWDLLEKTDQYVVQIFELTEWKKNAQRILLDMKKNGLAIPENLLDESDNNLSEKNKDQQVSIQSTVRVDTVFDDNSDYGKNTQ